MMEYRRLSGTIADNREKEGLKADVELPDDSESEGMSYEQ